MCIPFLIRHYLNVFGILICMAITVYPDYLRQFFDYNSKIILIITLILGAISIFIKCPRCRKEVGKTKGGIYTPFIGLKCNHCGQDLLKCKVEEDKEEEKKK